MTLADRQRWTVAHPPCDWFSPPAGLFRRRCYECILGGRTLESVTTWPFSIGLDVSATTADRLTVEWTVASNSPAAEPLGRLGVDLR